jgi:hypothetical protein
MRSVTASLVRLLALMSIDGVGRAMLHSRSREADHFVRLHRIAAIADDISVHFAIATPVSQSLPCAR